MALNRDNLRVNALLSWLNDAVGDTIKALEAEEKAQQDRTRQEQLRKTAKTIEEALNRRLLRAFENLERRVSLKSSATPSPMGLDVQQSEFAETSDASSGHEGDQEYVRDDSAGLKWRNAGEKEKGDIIVRENELNIGHREERREGGRDDKETNALSDPAGEKGAKPRETQQGNRKRLQPKGSFRVIPKPMGSDGPRAHYAATHMTIYVNTQHPQIAATGDESTVEFKILMAECAANEFALALTAIRIENGDPDVDPAQWPTIITAIRREESDTGAELAQAIIDYKKGLS